jgi:hypothetical protein
MCSAGDNAALPALGFPIRESAGQRLFSASPRLIAAVHALHRLLVPRHPPCALTILTVIEPSNGSVIPAIALSRDRFLCGYCAVFKDRRRLTPGPMANRRDKRGYRRADAGLSKLNSMPVAPIARSRRTRLSEHCGRPGSVDVLGPLVARAARYGQLAPAGRLIGAP